MTRDELRERVANMQSLPGVSQETVAAMLAFLDAAEAVPRDCVYDDCGTLSTSPAAPAGTGGTLPAPYAFDKRVDPLTHQLVYEAFHCSSEPDAEMEFVQNHGREPSTIRLVATLRATSTDEIRATPFSGAGRAAVIEECAKVCDGLQAAALKVSQEVLARKDRATSLVVHERADAYGVAANHLRALAARATGERGR